MRRIIAVAFMGATAAVLAACGSSGGGSGGAYAPAPAASNTAAPTSAGAGVAVATSKVGQILVDGKGRTLYLFEADKGAVSSCTGACAAAWPPYTVTGTPQAGAGVTGSLIATTTRSDGTHEVTYNGHPLYYFVGDKIAGATAGQGLSAFGAKWYVLAPNGNKIDND
ncbi:MAG: COG4315 family predicted lipoprotein [Frankia sp.]